MNRGEPLFVYGNWAAYDELSDGIELTEHLAMRQFAEMLRLRDHGVHFHAYLMDAFWFARDGGYREWRRPHWPDGPNRWLDACRERGVLPGLWFTANTLCHLEAVPAWQDSVDAKGWGMCLFEGGFLADFTEVLDQWYWRGVRVFKFDFADFNALPAGREDELGVAEVRACNVAAFRGALAGFRLAHPDAVLLGYNGFEEQECMDRTDRPQARFVDPAWLDVFDSLYCGDPRPADVPALSFWRSVDIYSDHMARAFAGCGIPLDRIENCGFMAGNTGTCYWRGKAGWRAMLLLSLARGGRIHVAYGDLSLFDEADARWWARTQALFAPSMRAGKTLAFGGIPGQAEPYGWRSLGGEVDLLTLVNPSLLPVAVALPAGEWRAAAPCSTTEIVGAPRIPNPSLPGAGSVANTIQLAGGQVLVLSSEEIDPLEPDDVLPLPETKTRPGEPPLPPKGEGRDEGWRPLPRSQLHRCPPLSSALVAAKQLMIEVPPGPSPRYLVVRQRDADGFAKRTYPTDDAPNAFRITHELNGEIVSLPPAPDRRIWSGMSWTLIPLPDDAHRGHWMIESMEPTEVTLHAELLEPL